MTEYNTDKLQEEREAGAEHHPYLKFVQHLNMTPCYKEMLLAGNKQIEMYLGENRKEYFALRKDFVSKYPEVTKTFEKIEPTDCTIV